METEIRKLADIAPDERNCNRGTERGSQMIENSFRQYGAGRSILLDRHGRIIAGNKSAEAAGSIGLDDVLVIKTDGTKLVAVQRTDIDLDSKAGRELAIADNRAGQVSLNWDTTVLQELSDETGAELKDFWTPQELEVLFKVDDEAKPDGNKKGLNQDDDLRFQIVIDCDTEEAQTSMLDRFEQEGIKCRPLIS